MFERKCTESLFQLRETILYSAESDVPFNNGPIKWTGIPSLF